MAAHRGRAEGIATGRQAKIGTLDRDVPTLPGDRRAYLEYLGGLETEARLWLEAIDYERNRVEQAIRAADRAREAADAAAADDDEPGDE